MSGLAAWQVTAGAPKRLRAGAIGLEKHLEDWIAADPALLEPGLRVVHRQLKLDGGPLDLLCVDTQGRATVVEIKKGRLVRDVVAQAIDYASSLATMPAATLRKHIVDKNGEAVLEEPAVAALVEESDAERREVAMVVVGTGSDTGLDRVLDFLASSFDFPIRAVTFDVFELPNGEQVLVREEREAEQPASVSTAKWTREGVIERAGGPDSPNGRMMLALAKAAERNNLYVKPYKWSFMFAPPWNKNRYLMTVWRTSRTDPLHVTYSAEAFAEFFGFSPEGVRAELGPEDRRVGADTDAAVLAAGLDRLFSAHEETAV